MHAANPQAKSIFGHALALNTAEERAAYLAQACGDDTALRAEVESLLAALEGAGDFLSQPATPPGATVDPESPPAADPEVGSHIGPYKLLQKLGEGGMGAVWVAEQQQPVKRRVALKVIKPGMDSGQVLRRFEAERQALALMDHTHIAKVLDAGTTPTGRPYFVMELVKGVPITKYCDELHLPIKERLELFVPVCQAIQHAHQKGIIHRDIKPSNVLVCMQDGKPVPKVIDFGVAKALHQKLAEQTLFTEVGAVVGTLEYMSPEQAELSALDIDTRADVYTLGVLLYELLTGTTPLDRKRLRQAAFTEMLRIIREEEPPRPSTRLTQSKESLASLAAQRRTEPARLTKEVRGELDWIVMKALEKDRTRRYETASGLARDVERYLAGEAVEAHPPSAGYRLRKVLSKHRAEVLTAAALLLLLLAGAGVSTWQAIRATAAESAARAAQLQAEQERDAKEEARQAEAEQRREAEAAKRRADEESAVAKAVNEFLQKDLLGQADIGNQASEGERNPKVTVRELLDRAGREIAGKFAGQEATEAAIRLTLGNAYRALGEYAEAQKHLERSVNLRKQKLGADHPDTLESMNDLALLYDIRGHYEEAEALYKQALEGFRVKLGADHSLTLDSMNNLAVLYQARGRYEEAKALHKQALEGYRAKLGAHHPSTLNSMSNLAVLYQAVGCYEEAETLYKQALEGRRAKLGTDHPHTLNSMYNLAVLYRTRGRYEEAEPLLKQALEGYRAKRGADHPATLKSMSGLAQFYQARGRYEEAEPLFKQTLKGFRAKLGADHPHTLISMNNLASLYLARGCYAEAEPLLRELVAVRTKTNQLNSLAHANTLAQLALVLLKQAKYAEAEPIARECLALRVKKQPDSWSTFNIKSLLGAALLGQKKYAEAEPLLLKGYDGMKKQQAKIPPQGKIRLVEAVERLVQLYEATGQKDEAAKWRKELEAIKAAEKKPEKQP